jgi:hypothetical protein
MDEIGAEGIGGGGGGRMGVGEARVREQGTGLVQRNLYKSAKISHAQSSTQTFLIYLLSPWKTRHEPQLPSMSRIVPKSYSKLSSL